MIWILLVIALPFAPQVLSGLFDLLLGGGGLTWGSSAPDVIANPASRFLTLCVISLIPFVEEIGWRGYAQDRLQETRTAFRASLILGVAWSVWHIPAFFIPGSYQAGLGAGTLEFWLFLVGVVALSVVVSWIYINTRRSILVMVLFHAMVNLSGELISLSEIGETFYTLCWIAASVGIIFLFGADPMRVGCGGATIDGDAQSLPVTVNPR